MVYSPGTDVSATIMIDYNAEISTSNIDCTILSVEAIEMTCDRSKDKNRKKRQKKKEKNKGKKQMAPRHFRRQIPSAVEHPKAWLVGIVRPLVDSSGAN